ncbi:hypothetical protein JGF05_24345, partial [Salmonella enterica subsp. enterica serovar Agona]|nr:hypothetical protein [Salmonella enterica subsp. enterica serovar Agona]
MKFFKPKTDAIEYIRVEPSFSKTSSNINNAKSGSDTNSQPGFILRSQIEEMIKNHRPKTEKEIKAESEGLIRLCSMAFIFLIVLSIFMLIVYFGIKDRELPDFANNLMALMTTLVGA